MHAGTLKHQLSFNHYVLKANTSGITQDESLQTPDPGGNCLNWVVGHILVSREHVLRAMELAAVWNEESARPYERGVGKFSADKASSLEEMLAVLDRSQEVLLQALDEMSDADFEAKSSFTASDNPDETIGSLLAGIVFHEAYHAGQTGLLRRLIGKEGVLQ